VNARGIITQAWAMFFQARVMETQGALADLPDPAKLTQRNHGLKYYATNYDRWFIFAWDHATKTGAWYRAPGEAPHHYIWTDEDPGVGWALCDGSSVTRSNDDGTTSSHTPKKLTDGRYIKGGTAVAGPNAATAPGLTGETADESSHTHAVDHDHGSFSSGLEQQAGVTAGTGAQLAAAGNHTHAVDPPAYSGPSGAGSAHRHGAGTLAVNAAGEPANVVLLPYYRL
jgi:hypothetical protein